MQVRDAQDKLVPDDPDYLGRHNDIRDELRPAVDHDLYALKNQGGPRLPRSMFDDLIGQSESIGDFKEGTRYFHFELSCGLIFCCYLFIHVYLFADGR